MFYMYAIILCGTAGATSPVPLLLSPAQESFYLGPYASVLEDKEGSYSIEDIAHGAQRTRFVAVEAETINFGRSTSTFWIHFQLHAAPPSRQEAGVQAWILENNWKRLHHIDLYYQEATSLEDVHTPRTWRVLPGGMNRFSKESPPAAEHLSVFELPRITERPQDFYLRIESEALLFLPLKVYAQEHYQRHSQKQYLLYGLFYGILFTIALLNLLLYPGSGDRIYIWYAIHLFFLSLSFMEFNLFLVSDTLPLLGNRSDRVYFALLFAAIAFLSLFTRNYIRPQKAVPLVEKAFAALALLHGLGMVLCFVAPFTVVLAYLLLVWLLSGLGYTLLPLFCWGEKNLPARLFLINWFILSAFCFRCFLVHLTLLPPSMGAFHSLQVGILVHALLFSFALMYRDYCAKKLKAESNKHSLLALKETEARFLRLLEHAPDIIYRLRLHPEVRFDYLSEATDSILGYRPTDFYRHPALAREISHPEDHNKLQRYLQRQQPLPPPEYTARWIHRDGHVVWTEQRWASIVDREGKLQAVEGIARDITRQKEAEAQLRERSQRLAEAERIAHIGWWDQDLVTKELQWSEEVYRIFRVSPEDFPKTQDSFFSLVHPEDRTRLLQLTEKCFQGEADWDVDHRIICPDGSIRMVHEKAQITFDKTGSPLRMLGTVQDITQRVQIEERQKELENEVQQAEKMKSLGLMASGIAHDFNNMLTGILNHAEQMQKMVPPGEGLALRSESIQKAVKHMAELSKQLLAYAGKRPMHKEILAISQEVREAADLMSDIRPTHPILELRLESDLPPILADPAQLRQTLINLMSNAAESMESHAGNILITTGAMYCDAPFLEDAVAGRGKIPGDYVYCKVIDSGSGIPERLQDKIFDPFFTTKNTSRGLGLATVLGTIRAHQGFLKVSSVADHGSMFTIFFPVATKKLEESQESRQETTQQAQPSQPYQGTVLLVDDFEDILELLSDILGQCGFTVHSTTSPKKALQWLSDDSLHFDLIIADQTMPDMTGLELMQRVRALKKNVRFVLCSGYSEYDLETLHQGEGPDAFLMKPFDENELFRMIDSVFL